MLTAVYCALKTKRRMTYENTRRTYQCSILDKPYLGLSLLHCDVKGERMKIPVKIYQDVTDTHTLQELWELCFWRMEAEILREGERIYLVYER